LSKVAIGLGLSLHSTTVSLELFVPFFKTVLLDV